MLVHNLISASPLSLSLRNRLYEPGSPCKRGDEGLVQVTDIARALADAKRLKSEKPKSWLPALSQQCEFLYVSPDNYDNDRIMNCDDRRDIALAMSRKLQPYVSSVA